MAYGIEDWKARIAGRNDITTGLVHLTRSTNVSDGLNVLYKILCDGKLNGSTTASGLIVGARPAVCFQEAPVYSLAQNIYTEQKYRESNPKAKVRYQGFGLQFHKSTIFDKGGRPAIYDKTASAKDYLPADQWWRIVNFNLSDKDSIIDWTHEREWRVPGDFSFKLSNAVILLPNHWAYQKFVKKCLDDGRVDILTDSRGIVQLASVFF